MDEQARQWGGKRRAGDEAYEAHVELLVADGQVQFIVAEDAEVAVFVGA